MCFFYHMGWDWLVASILSVSFLQSPTHTASVEESMESVESVDSVDSVGFERKGEDDDGHGGCSFLVVETRRRLLLSIRFDLGGEAGEIPRLTHIS